MLMGQLSGKCLFRGNQKLSTYCSSVPTPINCFVKEFSNQFKCFLIRVVSSCTYASLLFGLRLLILSDEFWYCACLLNLRVINTSRQRSDGIGIPSKNTYYWQKVASTLARVCAGASAKASASATWTWTWYTDVVMDMATETDITSICEIT